MGRYVPPRRSGQELVASSDGGACGGGVGEDERHLRPFALGDGHADASGSHGGRARASGRVRAWARQRAGARARERLGARMRVRARRSRTELEFGAD